MHSMTKSLNEASADGGPGARNRLASLATKIAAAGVVAIGLGFGSYAKATTLLTFGQTGGGDPITATNNVGDTTTTITGSNIGVTITSYLGGGTPIFATLNLNLTSVSAITNNAGTLTQSYSGTASFTSGGTNYLTATFSDALFAIQGASSLVIAAGDPPGSITYTSSILPPGDFLTPTALSFSFADVTPPADVIGTTLAAFTGNISGTSSSSVLVPTPEPASLALLGVGLSGLGFLRRQRRR